MQEQVKFKWPLAFLAICWLVHLFMMITDIDLRQYGLHPHSLHGTIGIFTAAFMHVESWGHIVGNTFQLIPMFAILCYFYGSATKKVMICGIVGPPLLTLFLGEMGTNHIGASGLLFTLWGFLGSMMFFKRTFTNTVISLLILIMYGNKLEYCFPSPIYNYSDQFHLFGLLIGIGCAYLHERNPNIKTNLNGE